MYEMYKIYEIYEIYENNNKTKLFIIIKIFFIINQL